MKKRSKAGIYILILVIMILVLMVGIIAVIYLSRMQRKMEEKEQQLRQEAEAVPEPTDIASPEPSPDSDDPAVQKKEMVAVIREAVERNDIQTVESVLRYISSDGSVQSYYEEDVAAVMLHLKKNLSDYQNFFSVLESEQTSMEEKNGNRYLLLSDENLRRMTNTEEPPESLIAEEVTLTGTGRKVAIDPGHQAHGNGEQEPIGPGASQTKAKVASGTTGRTTGVPEYQLNLDVSLKLRDELKARGYEVYMIREDNDVNISNAERAQAAAGSGADILIRIHANGSENTSVAGALTMAPSGSNPFLDGELVAKCQELSEIIISSFCEATGANSQGVYQTDEMSGLNWCTIPATIVEMGYMTNPDEDIRMQTEEYQNQMVQGIANGIDEYFGTE
ncbi:N-acetylmuramoyl-L-alanine amidase [bacterium]|nr:N-acetylmuramoyl-L-alanine amidase [bacterium]MDY3023069.1 N-acetylmuramoyl-L-alanine amidase [Oliverpabstia sp.]